MEKIWDYWNYNLKRKGCPPPSPYIMDWDVINRNLNDNESWDKAMKSIFICFGILTFILFVFGIFW